MTAVEDLVVEPIIGLEIHVQLATRTKLWCSCAVEFGADPNTRVCPVCLGLPGALPTLNRRAVDLATQAALALNCRIAERTKWDRKSYYYPDLPKNYQISQYHLPLAVEGFLEISNADEVRRIRIRRAHLEEDAGKSVHDLPDCTGVDLNRTGTPLLEIVTEPDLRSAAEARELAVQLQRLMRYLGVSEANMQKGQMRFEPNINCRILSEGREYVTPIVEVKNLNSFRSLYGAIEFELQRQTEAWQQDGRTAEPGNKSNRGWDDMREVTVPQREKEEAHDYRFFPDPDLLPVLLDRATIATQREQLPELPIPRKRRVIREYEVSPTDAPTLVDDRPTADLLDAAAAAGGDKSTLAKHFLGFWAHYANDRGTTIAGLGISAAHLADLSQLVKQGTVNPTSAAKIAEAMLAADGAMPGQRAAPEQLAARLDRLQVSDDGQVAKWIEQALDANPNALRDALSNGKKADAATGFLTGQVMRVSNGKADPKRVRAQLTKRLGERAGRA